MFIGIRFSTDPSEEERISQLTSGSTGFKYRMYLFFININFYVCVWVKNLCEMSEQLVWNDAPPRVAFGPTFFPSLQLTNLFAQAK